MSDRGVAEMIFRAWKSELKNKDRSMKSVRPNFDELAYNLYAAGVSSDIARELIKPAFKAHLPTDEQQKRTWKRMTRKWKTFNEFCESWEEAIEDAANAAFIVYFSPIDETIERIEQTITSNRQLKSTSEILKEHLRQNCDVSEEVW